MKVTILGCGASTGVPLIGCACEVCASGHSKNKRRRVSVYVETEKTCLLIDSSPDLRMQALDNGITRIDAVLYTHEHSDHSHGIDDLRRFNVLRQDYIPIYGDARAMELLERRFAYAFRPPEAEYGWYKAALTPHSIEAGESFDVGGVTVQAFDQMHGTITTLGYRIGGFAYSTDVNEMPEEAFSMLEGVNVWIVDCQGYKPLYTHSHLERTLRWIARVKPRRAILTHMGHEFDYDTLRRELPEGVEPAYDNMVIDNIG